MFAGNDNPAFKISSHATEKLTETALNTASTFADNTLKFSQALSECKNAQEAFAAASNLLQENASAAITATQKACSALLETFSFENAGMASMASAMGAGAKAKKRDKE